MLKVRGLQKKRYLIDSGESMGKRNDELVWNIVDWDFSLSADPLQALFMKAIGNGFKPPIKLVFMDSQGKDFAQSFELGPNGEILNSSEPKTEDEFEETDPIPPFFRYRLEDSTRTRRVEILTDPYMGE
jgi:hypothetical protein